ncbi:prepilin peptidase [Sphingobium sp. Sx8-8]|uniref:A24 family peptidase n=1 Tax=Sphingobium sp. Sx8-8 TaxID=2933617 RepID=UPI001F564DA4|nr:prepilin peptidase [Sphingobium sp. Sx8-8]
MIKDMILLAVSFVLIAAAVEDMARLRISNLFPMLVIGLYVPWVAVVGWENDIWHNGVVFLGAFALGCSLFALRWMGGGDIKLFSACALWFDWPAAVPWVIYITVGGGVLALVIMAARRMVPESVRSNSNIAIFAANGPIPYGVAIAFGTIMALYLVGPNPSGMARLPDFVRSL